MNILEQVFTYFTPFNALSAANIALGKDSRQSTTKDVRFASLATDGNLEQVVTRECTHTKPLQNSWWAVDLGGIYAVSHVAIWGRTDTWSKYYSNLLT